MSSAIIITFMTANTGDKASLILRRWSGVTRAADADEYLTYLERTGFAEYLQTPGNQGVVALQRHAGDLCELTLLTLWPSQQAIRRFAGEDLTRAVFYPEDDRYLIHRDTRARHYEVAFAANWNLPEQRPR
jgi:heme-degrading monooxygenase HmoA